MLIYIETLCPLCQLDFSDMFAGAVWSFLHSVLSQLAFLSSFSIGSDVGPTLSKLPVLESLSCHFLQWAVLSSPFLCLWPRPFCQQNWMVAGNFGCIDWHLLYCAPLYMDTEWFWRDHWLWWCTVLAITLWRYLVPAAFRLAWEFWVVETMDSSSSCWETTCRPPWLWYKFVGRRDAW